MGRPRKKAPDLTTEEAMRKLFPARAVTEAKKEAKKADEKATKKDSRYVLALCQVNNHQIAR
jgi:hypothetical protein